MAPDVNADICKLLASVQRGDLPPHIAGKLYDPLALALMKQDLMVRGLAFYADGRLSVTPEGAAATSALRPV